METAQAIYDAMQELAAVVILGWASFMLAVWIGVKVHRWAKELAVKHELRLIFCIAVMMFATIPFLGSNPAIIDAAILLLAVPYSVLFLYFGIIATFGDGDENS